MGKPLEARDPQYEYLPKMSARVICSRSEHTIAIDQHHIGEGDAKRIITTASIGSGMVVPGYPSVGVSILSPGARSDKEGVLTAFRRAVINHKCGPEIAAALWREMKNELARNGHIFEDIPEEPDSKLWCQDINCIICFGPQELGRRRKNDE